MPKRRVCLSSRQKEKKYYQAILHGIDQLQTTISLKLDSNSQRQNFPRQCSSCTQSTHQTSSGAFTALSFLPITHSSPQSAPRHCQSQLDNSKGIPTQQTEQFHPHQPKTSLIYNKNSCRHGFSQKAQVNKENSLRKSGVSRRLDDRIRSTIPLPISLTPLLQNKPADPHPVLSEVSDFYIKHINKLEADHKIQQLEGQFQQCLHAKRQGDQQSQMLLRWKMRQISVEVQRLKDLKATPSALIE